MTPAGFEAGQGRTRPVWDERARLAALDSYAILDTPPERAFDEVVRLAAQICDAPVALVSLVAGDRQFFKAELGIGVRQTPLEVSICAHAILRPGLFVVPDTAEDPRFAGNPLVCGSPHLRFYAGALLETAEGLPLGTLCVLDYVPRPEGLTAQQGFALQVLARQVMSQLELRRALKAREEDAARLAESERQFRVLADSMPQMVWATQPDGYHDYYNRRWYEFTGVPDGSTDGEGWNGMFHPEDQERAWIRWRHSLATGEPYEVEYRLRRADGVYRWTLGRALAVRDAGGRIVRWFGTCTDIEEQKQTEERLRSSEERLRLALGAAEMVGTWVWDVGTNRITADSGYARLFSVAPEAVAEGLPIEMLLPAIHPEDLPATEVAINRALAGEHDGVFEAEYRVLLRDGTIRWVNARGRCEHDATGRPTRFPGVVMDITERKQAEEGKELLARELSHRIKNIFTVVGGMVSISAAGAPAEVRSFAGVFRRRLNALAAAHEYVRPHSPESRPVAIETTLHGLLGTLLAPYEEAGAERVRLGGDDAPIGVKAATSLALIVHELATNAAKYGALAATEGRVTIAGERRDGNFALTWQERGGPPVEGPPQRRGFGTVLAERGAITQLGGTVAHDWAREGLTLRLEVPLERLAH
ncbi:PAS domain-containing protein [Paracraurococcus lichenis]|uniref:histidine kinase n=1 Tax=Paracraurococcus lichenis TaxID=3064888 RepID=A0ABT9DUD3_9PROT|nr:PAS domain-containing protein [Paracraurococcus sp. LOR1-02]MDO9707510.1 PAS domain-containing protein [Paracraurococcus sp. LOR1-02]